MNKLILSSFIAICILGQLCYADEGPNDLGSLLKRLKELDSHKLKQHASIYDNDELFNNLFPYDPIVKSSSAQIGSVLAAGGAGSAKNQKINNNNVIMLGVDTPDEQQSSVPKVSTETAINRKDLGTQPAAAEAKKVEEDFVFKPLEEPKLSPSTQQQPERPSLKKSPIDLEKAKSVAFNSREVRIMGPNGVEVEMKDDLATKVAVVFDNLRHETSQFLGDVNEKLDKGWTEFKQQVDKLVEEGKKQVAKL